MKKVFICLLVLFACIYANAQVTVYLEDGTTVQSPVYDASKFNINLNGTTYTNKEVLYLKDNESDPEILLPLLISTKITLL